MKKVIGLMLVLMALPAFSADLLVRAKSGTPGYVDDKTIDVNGLAPGDKIVLQLVLENLDFTLAGFEGEFQFPTWLVLVDVTAVGTPTTPYTTELPTTQKLPADAAGNDTATTFRNDKGYARVGGVITDPAMRPNSGDWVLAEFCFILGADFYSESTCISAAEVLRFLACDTGAANCHIIADDAAAAVAVTYDNASMTVDMVNTGTTFVKGDVNGSGDRTTLDVGPLIQCAVFGQAATGCPLTGAPAEEYNTKADVNCSGSVTTLDIGPLIQRVTGQANRPSNKRMNYNELAANDGVLTMPGGAKAMVVGVELQVQGKVGFPAAPQLDKDAIDAGWQVSANHIQGANVYKYLLFNMSGTDGIVPDIQIPYEVMGEKARVGVALVETYAADNRPVDYAPSLGRYDLIENPEQ
jgi:hypothetical protein